MKKVITILFIGLLNISSVCLAEVGENTVIRDNTDNHIIIADNANLTAGFGSRLTDSGIIESSEAEARLVPMNAIVFATTMLVLGLLFRRKKKVKSNDVVGAFARIN